jgi:hypothetical protein
MPQSAHCPKRSQLCRRLGRLSMLVIFSSAALMALPGCALLTVKTMDKDRPDKDCTTGNLGARLDLLIGTTAGLTGGVATALLIDSDGRDEVFIGPAIAGGVLGAAALASAVYGFTKTSQCRDHYRVIGKPISSETGKAGSCYLGGGLAGLLVGGLICAGMAVHESSGPESTPPSGARRPRTPPKELPTGVESTCGEGGKPIATCHDGTLWCADSIRGACRSHGGVHEWIE